MLKTRKRLNPMSPQKVDQLNGEVEDRVALCRRAGGEPHFITRVIRFNNGNHMILTTVVCKGGICEVCHQWKPQLWPHEKNPRGLGGKLSLENTIMVDNNCHRLEQGNYPRWSKKEMQNERTPDYI